jgi:hypothetical protein
MVVESGFCENQGSYQARRIAEIRRTSPVFVEWFARDFKTKRDRLVVSHSGLALRPSKTPTERVATAGAQSLICKSQRKPYGALYARIFKRSEIRKIGISKLLFNINGY